MQDAIVSGCGTAISCNTRGNETMPVKLRIMCVVSLIAQKVSSQAQDTKACFENEKARLKRGHFDALKSARVTLQALIVLFRELCDLMSKARNLPACGVAVNDPALGCTHQFRFRACHCL